MGNLKRRCDEDGNRIIEVYEGDYNQDQHDLHKLQQSNKALREALIKSKQLCELINNSPRGPIKSAKAEELAFELEHEIIQAKKD